MRNYIINISTRIAAVVARVVAVAVDVIRNGKASDGMHLYLHSWLKQGTWQTTLKRTCPQLSECCSELSIGEFMGSPMMRWMRPQVSLGLIPRS